MNISCTYKCKDSFDKCGEVRVPVNKIGRIYDYMKEHPNKRYVIIVDRDLDEDLYKQIDYAKNFNYTLCVYNISLLYDLLKKEYNAYFGFPVTDFEQLSQLILKEVTDIVIGGPLGFHMETVRSKCGASIVVRVDPRYSENALFLGPAQALGANSFYIRPEDLKYYEEYVDILEFRNVEQEEEETLINIYDRRSFMHDLSLLIKQLEYPVNNKVIPDNFAEQRVNCRQRCKAGHKCHYCANCLRTAQTTFNFMRKPKEEGDLSEHREEREHIETTSDVE